MQTRKLLEARERSGKEVCGSWVFTKKFLEGDPVGVRGGGSTQKGGSAKD